MARAAPRAARRRARRSEGARNVVTSHLALRIHFAPCVADSLRSLKVKTNSGHAKNHVFYGSKRPSGAKTRGRVFQNVTGIYTMLRNNAEGTNRARTAA
jgi:hypothetical protein